MHKSFAPVTDIHWNVWTYTERGQISLFINTHEREVIDRMHFILYRRHLILIYSIPVQDTQILLHKI